MRIDEVLFPQTRARLLALCFLNPHRRFYLREMIRRLGGGRGTVQREVENLTKVGLLIVEREGKRVYYRANPDCVVFSAVQELLENTIGPTGRLRDALEPLRPGIAVAFIYGSVARDAATDESDLDLMVIGRVTFEEVVRAIRPLEDEQPREINPSVYGEEDFQTKLREKSPFLENVMEDAKKFVIGGPRELEGLV